MEPQSSAFSVAAQHVIWGYGFRHTDDGHPWVAHLLGRLDLRDFYDRYRFESLAELLFPDQHVAALSAESRNFLSDPDLELVLGERVVSQVETVGTISLDCTHGTQHRGPISDRKLELETELLASLHSKLRTEGFTPPDGDGLRGYFLVSDRSYAFRLVGGQHRAAVLAALGFPALPLTFEPGFPRFVDANELPRREKFFLEALLDARCHGAKRNFLSEMIRT